jgi:phenylpropionate dioxygenase-like ring-hydroxylating dioxygenase large terminal subunit
MNYLRNTWYAAVWSEDLGQAALPRTLLDEPIVFVRAGGGEPVALADRCPHRFAPLSLGKKVGDSLQCGYHGLRFGMDGKCIYNPHGPIPPAARVTTYPLLERYGMVWIWMGEASRADPALLPDFSVIADTERFAIFRSTLKTPANYQLAIDNLLDLSHAQYLHPLLGNLDSNERTRFHTRIEGNTVWSLNDMPGEPVTKLFQMLWKSDSSVGDRRANMRWDAPSNLLLDVGFTECGRPPSEGATLWSAHLLTPETESSTHYFWAGARDTCREDSVLGEKIRVAISAAFVNEDGPMIAACQQRMGGLELMELGPLLLKSDAAAVSARRVLAELIEQERQPDRPHAGFCGPAVISS